ncbi:hypothetical protein GQR58_026531 [Nymphon striatum]|nr:hypothetical protein GQR58_026531 [Nymphon striatum]
MQISIRFCMYCFNAMFLELGAEHDDEMLCVYAVSQELFLLWHKMHSLLPTKFNVHFTIYSTTLPAFRSLKTQDSFQRNKNTSFECQNISIISSAFCFFNDQNDSFLKKRPLPLAKWLPAPPPVVFNSFEEFMNIYDKLRIIIRRQLCEERYSTVHNLIQFYADYLLHSCPDDFENFFLDYKPGLIYDNFSCTGLALDLWNRISSSKLSFLAPSIGKSLYLASSEEIITNVDLYCSYNPPNAFGVEKEHVLLCLKILLTGRSGYVLLDPGYHIRCPIIVMDDGQYPQSTGVSETDIDDWYLQNTTNKCRKEYKYANHHSKQYVKWIIREIRNGHAKIINNLIHCGNAFMSPLDVVERRNLVFNFKNLIARNEHGIYAGLYFVMKKNSSFVLFYPIKGLRKEIRIPFSYFMQSIKKKDYEEAIKECCIKVGYQGNELHYLLHKVVEISEDKIFMQKSEKVDDKINKSSIY